MPLKRRLIAIVGATATGKTALGIELARTCEGEIVNADSRQVYRHMDIGTAKPTPVELAAAPHHLVDIVDPDEPFSLRSWLDLAHDAVADAWARGKLPLLVGGTGQYVWALLEGWRVPRVPPQSDLRDELSARPPDELLAELHGVDPAAEEFIDPRNVRRVIRALEVHAATGKPLSYWRTKETPPFDALIIGISHSRESLYTRIDGRVDSMFERGLVDEVASLRGKGYARNLPSMSGIGYREVSEYLDGDCTLQSAIDRTKTGTHRLARHQNSWFKAADQRIHWVEAAEQANDRVRFWLES